MHAQDEPTATPEPETTTQERVYTREEVTKPAVILSMPEPVLQRKLGKTFDVSGIVKVEIVLTSSGKVGDVKVVEGLSKAQNFASVKAAHRITFMPAMKNGLPVSQSYAAEYRFTMTTNEFGKPEELKGLKKFYVDTWGDRAAREELTGELLRLMPSLELVDRTEQADCVILYSPYARMEQPFVTDMKGRVQYETPKRVRGGRGWAVKPLAADRQRVILYYEDMKYSFAEREPTTNFARAFIDAYKKANGIPK